MHRAVELAAFGIEAVAVTLIVISFLFATLRFLLRVSQRQNTAYSDYKLLLGQSMLLGLEFLVAADVIRTVALDPTLSNIEVLGLLVVMRTFLSWSLVVELEGRFPWQSAGAPPQSERMGSHNARTNPEVPAGVLNKSFRRSVHASFSPPANGADPSRMGKVSIL